jgi:hypothetical protein
MGMETEQPSADEEVVADLKIRGKWIVCRCCKGKFDSDAKYEAHLKVK